MAITPISAADLAPWLGTQEPAVRAWVDAVGFSAKPHSTCLVPGARNALGRVLVGAPDPLGPWALAGLPLSLAEGDYRLDPSVDSRLDAADAAALAVGWALGGYQFSRYKKATRAPARLVAPTACDIVECHRLAYAIGLVRAIIAAAPHLNQRRFCG